jgi:hypothetical protein
VVWAKAIVALPLGTGNRSSVRRTTAIAMFDYAQFLTAIPCMSRMSVAATLLRFCSFRFRNMAYSLAHCLLRHPWRRTRDRVRRAFVFATVVTVSRPPPYRLAGSAARYS